MKNRSDARFTDYPIQSTINGIVIFESPWFWDQGIHDKVKIFNFNYDGKRFTRTIVFGRTPCKHILSARMQLAYLRNKWLPNMIQKTFEWYNREHRPSIAPTL